MRHPPEKDLVVLCMLNRSGPMLVFDSGTVKPRPCRIFAARASAVASFFSSSRSYVLFSSTLRSNVSSVSSPASLRFASIASLPCMPLSSSSEIRHASSASASARSRSAEPSSPPFSSAAATRSMAASSSILRLRSCCSSTSAATTDSSADRSSPTTSCSTNRMSMKSGTGSLRRASSFMTVVLPMPLGPTKPYRRPCTIVKSVLVRSSFPRADTLNPSILMSLELAICSRCSSVKLAHRTLNASSSSCIACSFAMASFRAASSSFCRALRSSFSVLPPSTIVFCSRSTVSVSPSDSEEGRSMSSMYPPPPFLAFFKTGGARPEGGPRGAGRALFASSAAFFASFLAFLAARSSAVSSGLSFFLSFSFLSPFFSAGA